MKRELITARETETLSIEIGVLSPDSEIQEKQQEQSSEPLQGKITKDKLAYFQGKAGSDHGIKINLSGRHGVKSAWLSLSHLLSDGDPMETEEMSRAMESLGISDMGKIRVKSVECKALGFQQNFIPPQTLNAQMLEELSLLSGILVKLEEQENTQLFRELLEEEKIKEVTNNMINTLIHKYEVMKDTADTGLFVAEKEVVGICPRCDGSVLYGDKHKNYYCDNKACSFSLWENNKLFASMGKKITKSIVTDFLTKGESYVKGFVSSKTGKSFNASVVMKDTEKYVNFDLKFDK